jgi:hypothetical protein
MCPVQVLPAALGCLILYCWALVENVVFIAVLSIAALAAFAVWEEWLNLIGPDATAKEPRFALFVVALANGPSQSGDQSRLPFELDQCSTPLCTINKAVSD